MSTADDKNFLWYYIVIRQSCVTLYTVDHIGLSFLEFDHTIVLHICLAPFPIYSHLLAENLGLYAVSFNDDVSNGPV